MGQAASSKEKNNQHTKAPVYRPFCGPPTHQFSHWQLVKRSDGDGYRFIPIYTNTTKKSLSVADNPREKVVDPDFLKEKFKHEQHCDEKSIPKRRNAMCMEIEKVTMVNSRTNCSTLREERKQLIIKYNYSRIVRSKCSEQ